MRTSLTLGAALALVATVDASYAPVLTSCSTSAVTLRNSGSVAKGTQALHPDEAAYLAARKVNTASALRTYIDHTTTKKAWGGSRKLLTAETAPVIALALSGGGERASLFDAALINVFDHRNSTSVAAGFGGLLQGSAYMSALSGGSWTLLSFVSQDMPLVYDMVVGSDDNPGWMLDENLASPGTTAELTEFLTQSIVELEGKYEDGFAVTLIDIWGRSIAHHYLPGTTENNFFESTNAVDHGANITMSSFRNLTTYKSHDMPFPIIISTAYSPSEVNDTAYDGATVPLDTVSSQHARFHSPAHPQLTQTFLAPADRVRVHSHRVWLVRPLARALHPDRLARHIPHQRQGRLGAVRHQL